MSVIDIDPYGLQNADGTAVEYAGASATKQALYLWLTSKINTKNIVNYSPVVVLKRIFR
jgi:hypothetical protein